MPAKVVDASALGAVLFGERDGDAIAHRLEGERLIAPALLVFEIANVCLKKLRLQPARREFFLGAFDFLDAMAIEFIEVDHQAVILLAERHGLTTYDASYLWIARELHADLVTLDKRLGTAAASGH
jgi:predicted nucleic acid-binding protein